MSETAERNKILCYKDDWRIGMIIFSLPFTFIIEGILTTEFSSLLGKKVGHTTVGILWIESKTWKKIHKSNSFKQANHKSN